MIAFLERAVHSVFCACLYESLSICVRVSFPHGFDGVMVDLILLVPAHRLSFYLTFYLS